MQSLNRNYLELEKQCQAEQKDKDVSGEILSYHRKEAELLRQDTLAYIKEIKVLKSTIQLLEARLRKYDRSDGTCGLSYDELLENNRQIEAEVSKLSLKMQYCQEEKDRVDE